MLEVGGVTRLADERERVMMKGRVLGVGWGGKEADEKDRKREARKTHERHRPWLIGKGTAGSAPRGRDRKPKKSANGNKLTRSSKDSAPSCPPLSFKSPGPSTAETAFTLSKVTTLLATKWPKRKTSMPHTT